MLDNRLLFIGYMSFYNNMDFMKHIYLNLSRQDKYLYKYYVYAQRYLDEKTCDLIWRFLNEDEEEEEELLRRVLYERQFRFRG